MEGIPKYVGIDIWACEGMLVAEKTHSKCPCGTARHLRHLKSCQSLKPR
uniref:Uncharacterized protein n=1 Tax=Rhizophora mucronata TaxID=61149 RepID=A0A2P2IM75_RHIMU